MRNVAISQNTPPVLAQAIAEGAVAAENKALKEAIDMLMWEIREKDAIIAAYRYKELHAGEEMLKKYRRSRPRVGFWRRLSIACGLIA